MVTGLGCSKHGEAKPRLGLILVSMSSPTNEKFVVIHGSSS